MTSSTAVCFGELASSNSSMSPPSASAPSEVVDGTICPSLLQIVAPQPRRPVTFSVENLADDACHEANGRPRSADAGPRPELDAVPSSAGLSSPRQLDRIRSDFTPTLGSEAQSVVDRIKRLVPPPLPSRSSITSLVRPGRRIEKGKRTPQACERCRIRKTKCNGARPSCERCTKRGANCDYVLDHKAVRFQLRKLQKEGLLPETINISRRTKSHGAVPVPMTRPMRMTRSRSRLA
ncbi:uncharacterized protein C8Q71DRAFT_245991 [Rhodofomes roseus]|uniref:Zn(2)-C6 fungal-type domain-containing protein n=1 Tax=Rhodofomes roseus TaxID=34475 RepID=A0ABQ8K6U1_9APHY|nr:uncharacterized protein C8Q71DRAFT_245991 [Rhodofomes roseus]KAH9832961.1 hypothetical protein C8Q71DRAFT_245991 [Rhodofomes roseus]